MKKIICLVGDGVGPELIEHSIKLIELLKPLLTNQYEITSTPFGGAAIDMYGHPFPHEVAAIVKTGDAILLGAIGHPKYDNAPIRPEQGLLAIRKELNLYANIRGLTVPENLAKYSPLKPQIITGTDMIIVRELIGGAYFGTKMLADDQAMDEMAYSRKLIEDIVHYGFRLAQTRSKKLTSVDKANVLATSKLWRKIVDEIAPQYPDVVLNHMLVDAMAMELIARPTKYDVVVMENLFGDILSDELAAIAGSLGLLPSGSFGHGGIALYEPAHGSAPDIANCDVVNPVAMFLSVAMMLRVSFNETAAAEAIETAINQAMENGVVTKDLDAQNGVATSIFIEEIAQQLNKKRGN
ncbi:MAG: 3-isopropylmalate dehydrogenase [Culicoidibacterales bacterium]